MNTATDWRDLNAVPIYSERPGVWHAAKILGLPKDRAYRCANDGSIPTFRVGPRKLVPVVKLREMLGEATDQAPADTRPSFADELQALVDVLRNQQAS